MAEITINGKRYQFQGKKMILQVALENGAVRNRAFGPLGQSAPQPDSTADPGIPYYCYHPGLSIVGSCRLCLAEVWTPHPHTHELQLALKLLPTCATPAVDGMVVSTQTPKAIANQQFCLECFLLSHPLDCPVCDKAGECKLQDYSFRFGHSESRFIEDKIKNPVKDIGPTVKLYTDRCVFCSRCVRFCREVTGTGELGWIGRGAYQEIDVFPGKPLTNELAANVVDLCPVGALVEKDFLFHQRAWYLTAVPSIDGLTASGDNIWIDQNDGRIYRIRPRTNMQINKWWISDEIRASWKAVHADSRISNPFRRGARGCEQCPWESAYAQIHEALSLIVKNHGPGSLVLVASPMLSCEDAYLLGRWIRSVDAAALVVLGPIPTNGQDKTFPGGYTVFAEKCPNSRGVLLALRFAIHASGASASPPGVSSDAQTGDAPMTFDVFRRRLDEDRRQPMGIVLTGNYPVPWTGDRRTNVMRGRFSVVIDAFFTGPAADADICLPGATWVEKAGTFLDARRHLQAFNRAIPVLGLARSEGQIALDLKAAWDSGFQATPFDASAVRRQMGGIFATEVQYPAPSKPTAEVMQFMDL